MSNSSAIMSRGSLPSGANRIERYRGLSFLQLRIPLELHWDLRELLAKRQISVNAVAEDMVKRYMVYMRSAEYEVPGRSNLTQKKTKIKKGGGKVTRFDEIELDPMPVLAKPGVVELDSVEQINTAD